MMEQIWLIICFQALTSHVWQWMPPIVNGLEQMETEFILSQPTIIQRSSISWPLTAIC